LLQHGELDAARAAFDRVAEQLPPLADHARLYAAQAALQKERLDETLSRLVQLLATPVPPVARRAGLMYADTLIRAGQPQTALVVLSRLLTEPLDDTAYARAWWLLGQAADRAGDRSLALRAYAMAWWSVPDAPDAAAAEQRLRDLEPDRAPVPPGDARVQRAGRLMAAGEFTMAEQELADAVRQPLPPVLAADAWYRLGILRLRTHGAADAFQQSADSAEDTRPRALFWLGRALAWSDRREKAKGIWRRVVSEYASSGWAPRAMLALAATAELQNDLPTARQWLLRLTQQYPNSGSADEGRWRLGWLAFRQGRLRDAERQFLDAATQFPATVRAAANLYWAAKARARRGVEARTLLVEVASRYPLTFYGRRAQEVAGLPEPEAPAAPSATRLADDHVQLPYEELAGLGFDTDAVELVEALLESSPDPRMQRTAAWLWARMGMYHRSVAAVEQTLRPAGGIADRELWTLAYPLVYVDEVRRAASAERVDPYLVLALMREESRFNPRVVSPAGAVGLTQLLPSTASAVVGTATAPDLMDPETNIAIGTRYLAGVLRRFKGDVVLALAAYNAGPPAARRMAQMPRADLDVFLESISIVETRVYVQRVLQSYATYRWLYRQESVFAGRGTDVRRGDGALR
jgi:soluble lytic murein transglycosylase